MRRNILIFMLLIVALMVLLALDLWMGPTALDMQSTIGWQIFRDIRLPRALTAILAGAALSVSGMMMQTLFRNPLAGPSILGISSGAMLGVAIVVMLGSMLGFSAHSGVVIVAAVTGALLTLMLVLSVSGKVKSNVSLLIVGMMIGSVAGALVNVMQNFSNPDSLKLFVVWTLGSLSSVGWKEMAYMLPMLIIGLMMLIFLVKPLNGLLLGENYAQGLGIPIKRIRVLIVLATGLLAGGITAFCGPIAFIGVAVPHIARGIMKTSNHHIVMPACLLVGADLLLLCDIVANAFTYPLPISTISALFGAPIIIYIIVKRQ